MRFTPQGGVSSLDPLKVRKRSVDQAMFPLASRASAFPVDDPNRLRGRIAPAKAESIRPLHRGLILLQRSVPRNQSKPIETVTLSKHQPFPQFGES
jgi:hypothetical protein